MQAYTFASYKIRSGFEDEFIAAWSKLSATFASLPEPPLSGTLIRHLEDPSRFYGFGPWRSPDHIKAMRDNMQAQQAFDHIRSLCESMSVDEYEVITHVDVSSVSRLDRRS